MRNGDRQGSRRTFAMYVRQSEITDFHLKSPWLEFPEAFRQLGYDAILITGKINVSEALKIRTYETGLVGERKAIAPREFLRVLPILHTERPTIGLVYASMSLAPVFVAISRLGRSMLNALRPSNVPRPVWVNKLDWDGDRTGGFGLLSYSIRRLVIALTSHIYDWTTVEGHSALDRISRIPLINAQRLMVLPIGYPQDYYRVTRYDDTKREPIVLCASRISPQKGLDVLLRSFAIARQTHPEWKLLHVGPTSDEQYLSQLRDVVDTLQLKECVRFAGFVSDVELKSLYLRASIFCLPSLYESAGQVRMEAMVNGLPLLTTTAGPGEDFREMGAVVVPINNVSRLAQAMSDLMSSEARRRNVSANQQRLLPSYLDVVRVLLSKVSADPFT